MYFVLEQKITVDHEKNIQIIVKIISNNNVDKTPIILLPGGPGGSSSLFHSNISFLVKHGPVILIDPRGTGDSDKNYPEFWDLDHYIEDVEMVRHELKLSKINLLGRSYGGVAAQGYAIKYQQFIEKLILVATTTDHSFIQKAEKNLVKFGTQDQQTDGKCILEGKIKDNEHLTKIFINLDPIYSIRAKNDKILLKKLAKHSYKDFSHICLNIGFSTFLRKFDFTNQIKNIKVPTLVIGAKYDWICDPSFSYKIAMSIENSKLVLLPGGHDLFLDCKNEYISEINNFLKNYSNQNSQIL